MNNRKLIVSWNSYTWVHSLAGLISRNPKSFDVLIVCDDSNLPTHWTRAKFCKEAIYAQRKYDLFQIGTQLGIQKLSNLLYDPENLDIENLAAKLQMHILMTNPQEIYFQDIGILYEIFFVLNKKLKIDIFAFDKFTNTTDIISLTDEEQEEKNKLFNLIVADSECYIYYEDKEYLTKL